MIYLGIDPGQHGAIVALKDNKVIYKSVFDKKEYRRIVSACVELDDTVAVVEKVHAMPSQGVTSMFSFGENFGWIQGLLDAFEVPFALVPPQQWKKYFGLSAPKGTDKKVIKRNSIERAKTLFPDLSLRATPRCKVDHDGLAEGALMSVFCRDQYKQFFKR